MKEIYLAGGCFWGLQRYFSCVRGVVDTQAGYANGNMMYPSYVEVCTGATGFAETVRVRYDEKILPLAGILELYFKAIDPTAKDRQGGDIGPQYRTGIYFIGAEDGETAILFLSKEREKYRKPVVVEVRPLENYFPAEEYHQHYLQKNPDGYCHIGKEAFIYAGEYKVPTAAE